MGGEGWGSESDVGGEGGEGGEGNEVVFKMQTQMNRQTNKTD